MYSLVIFDLRLEVDIQDWRKKTTPTLTSRLIVYLWSHQVPKQL